MIQTLAGTVEPVKVSPPEAEVLFNNKPMMDLILRQARLMDGHLVDIGIVDGVITAIEPHLPQKGRRELAVRGQLTLPAFVNGQLHACKSFWRRLLHTLPPEVQALPRFTAAKQVKQLYTADGVFARVDEVMRLAIEHGTCAIRLPKQNERTSCLCFEVLRKV